MAVGFDGFFVWRLVLWTASIILACMDKLNLDEVFLVIAISVSSTRGCRPLTLSKSPIIPSINLTWREREREHDELFCGHCSAKILATSSKPSRIGDWISSRLGLETIMNI